MRFAKVKKKIGYIAYLLLFTIIAAELLLRVYNPFPASVSGDRITLHTNKKAIFRNVYTSGGLDSISIVYKNSLGFRGPEPPQDPDQHLSIVAVGGSTTECLFIPEEKTWTHLLGQKLKSRFDKVWINNAGLNGHSTYGHLKLMQEHIVKIKPKYCLFLIGCNEVDRPELAGQDKNILTETQSPIVKLARYSRLVNVLLNLYRHARAVEREWVNNVEFTLYGKEKRIITDSAMKQDSVKQLPMVAAYAERLKALITTCRNAHIEPVFITQPCLLGDTVDDRTGVDLSTFPYFIRNGKSYWKIIELYNEKTKEIAAQENIFLIDLASRMPHSSNYFYDVNHYNNAGCKLVSEIISDALIAHLANPTTATAPPADQ